MASGPAHRTNIAAFIQQRELDALGCTLTTAPATKRHRPLDGTYARPIKHIALMADTMPVLYVSTEACTGCAMLVGVT